MTEAKTAQEASATALQKKTAALKSFTKKTQASAPQETTDLTNVTENMCRLWTVMITIQQICLNQLSGCQPCLPPPRFV